MTLTETRPVFLLTGFASEYSLDVIAEMLRHNGEKVVEVDFSVTGIPYLGNTEVVLITSQHPARTGWIFKRGYGWASPYDRYLSPMECIQQLNVCCSVFVPHDLEQPIIPDEIGYMSLFDFYCSPYEFNPGLSLWCQPLYTGWAKYTDMNTGEFMHQFLARKNGVFFVNQLIMLMRLGGVTHLLREYAVMIDQEVPFKFPRWPGVADLEKKLEQAGAKVIPAETSSTQVIASAAQVFSNASGSVLSEAAYLGVSAQVIAPRTTTLPASTSRCKNRRPFDFQLLMSSIRNHLDDINRP